MQPEPVVGARCKLRVCRWESTIHIHIRLLRTVKPQLYTKIKQSASKNYNNNNYYYDYYYYDDDDDNLGKLVPER